MTGCQYLLPNTLGAFLALLSVASAGPAYTSANPPRTGPTVPGNRAMLRGGIAHAPENAPESVKRAIWATNFLTRKPYVWGGGHGSFYERGYDCSGCPDRPAASSRWKSYERHPPGDPWDA